MSESDKSYRARIPLDMPLALLNPLESIVALEDYSRLTMYFRDTVIKTNARGYVNMSFQKKKGYSQPDFGTAGETKRVDFYVPEQEKKRFRKIIKGDGYSSIKLFFVLLSINVIEAGTTKLVRIIPEMEEISD